MKDKVIINITEIILNTSSTLKERNQKKTSITDILNNPVERTESWKQPLPFRTAVGH